MTLCCALIHILFAVIYLIAFRLEEDCSSWRQQWIKYVKQYGRYKHCFAKIKMAWNLMKEFITTLAKNLPGKKCFGSYRYFSSLLLTPCTPTLKGKGSGNLCVIALAHARNPNVTVVY